MPNNTYKDRYANLKGAYPELPWNFIRYRFIPELVIGESKQATLAENIRRVIRSTGINQQVLTAEDPALSIKDDGNCAARSLIFGILIAASVAIKNKTSDALPMQETLQLLYADTIDLKEYYQQHCSELLMQSQEFPASCNNILAVIQAVFYNKISTTELVYQANKDHQSITSPLNLAFTDLIHYILWKSAISILQTNHPLISDESTKVYLIYGNQNKKCKRIIDLLKTGISHTPEKLALIYKYLNISSQNLLINTHMQVHMIHLGIIDSPVAFTTVTTPCGHTHLLLNDRIRQQILLESTYRSILQYEDLEMRYQLLGIVYNPIISPEYNLYAAKKNLATMREMALQALYDSTFPHKFFAVNDLFFNKIRPLTWQIENQDVLFKLESLLYSWYVNITNYSGLNYQVIINNRTLIRNVLNNMYKGESGTLSPLFNDPQNLHIKFHIGGLNINDYSFFVDLGIIILSPKDYQSILILINGLNRTVINVNAPNFLTQLSAMTDYLLHLLAFNFITDLMRAHIHSVTSKFFMQEINKMPQHIVTIGHPGYKTHLQEQNNINFAAKILRAALDKIFPCIANNTIKSIEPYHNQVTNIEPSTKTPALLTIEYETETLNNIIDKLVTAKKDLDVVFSGKFIEFKKQLLQILTNHQTAKKQIITNTIISFNNKTNTQRSVNLTNVEKYLSHLQERTKTPITNMWLNIEFKRLLRKYSQSEATLWQKEKHNFLTKLHAEIKNNPEKTYAACFSTVRDSPAHEFQKIFSHSRMIKHTFFGNSSVIKMVNKLQNLDNNTYYST